MVAGQIGQVVTVPADVELEFRCELVQCRHHNMEVQTVSEVLYVLVTLAILAQLLLMDIFLTGVSVVASLTIVEAMDFSLELRLEYVFHHKMEDHHVPMDLYLNLVRLLFLASKNLQAIRMTTRPHHPICLSLLLQELVVCSFLR